MANDITNTPITYDFLNHKKAKNVFAKLDYALRNGIHIQREYPSNVNLYRFLNDSDNYESLKNFYKEYYNLNLVREGSDFNNYYYLNFNQDGKGNVPSDNRDYLKNEYIIIGMLFFKMYKLDGNIELESVSGFISLLHEEYEEQRNALRKLINDNSSDKSTDLGDERFEYVVTKSFEKFADLGWLIWESDDLRDKFKIMPSFERLRINYQPQIETIEDLIKEIKDAE